MSNPLMEKMLGLPEFEVTDFKQNEYDMGFWVQTKEKPDTCPACGCYQPNLGVAKTRTQTIRDLNNQGKRVALMLKRRYYRCRECGQIFAEPLKSVDGKGRITNRLRKEIGQKAISTPFVDIENEYKISDTTIRNAFLEAVKSIPTVSAQETPSVLGIDEICLMRDDYHHTQPWAVIANGDENTVMELLKGRSKQTIVDLLESLQQPKKVKVVTMDMWAGYRTAVQEVLPHTLVVVDKFHVVRMANDELDSIRRSITRTGPYTLKQNRSIFLARGDNLSERAADIRDDWFEKYPLLESAYNLKEDFYRMYDCKSRSDAEYYYRCWKSSIPKELPGFKRICRTVERSYDEIFNYFDAPYTNAFVEGLNSVIRAIAQQGRGYDFEVLRGKVLLGAGRKRVYPKTDFGTMSYMTFDRFMTRDFGVPFANIIAKIDAGLLSSGEPKQP